MIDTAFYLVTRDILERAGLVGQRYRSADGRYVLDNKDLSRVRFTTDEYINGLAGVEKITAEQAKQIIADGGYSMKDPVETVQQPQQEQEETVVENESEAPVSEESESEESEVVEPEMESAPEQEVEQTNEEEE